MFHHGQSRNKQIGTEADGTSLPRAPVKLHTVTLTVYPESVSAERMKQRVKYRRFHERWTFSGITSQPLDCPHLRLRSCRLSYLVLCQDQTCKRMKDQTKLRLVLVRHVRERKGHIVHLMDRRFHRTSTVDELCLVLVRTGW